MGDFTKNLPRLLRNGPRKPQPMGLQVVPQVVFRKVLRPDIVVLKDDAEQFREVDGKVEIFGCAPRRNAEGAMLLSETGQLVVDDEPSWHAPPAGWKILRPGDKAADDDFQIAHVLVDFVIDASVVGPNGQPTQTPLELGEICPRVPYADFMAAYRAARGIAPPVNGTEPEAQAPA